MNLTQLLFVFYFAIIAYCDGVPDESSLLVGSEFCTNGPVVWCKNLTTASACNAVKHCIQTVWSMSEPDQDYECSACVVRITSIKNSVNSNTTEEDIEGVLNLACEYDTLVKILHKECKTAVHNYVVNHIKDLLDLLSSNVSPQTSCKIIGLCGFKNTIFPISSPDVDEDVVVKYDNIVLHFPAHDQIIKVNLHELEKSKANEDQQLVGANKCTWGPSYWCGSLINSKECHSTSHCVDKIWSKTTYPEDSDSVCQICKNMVQQAKDQLLSNETQEELREVFEGSCKLIPIKDVRKECIKLADEFVPELTEMLVSEMNPTAVCTVAGLCNSARIDGLLATEKSDIDFSNYDACSNCTAAFKFYHKYMEQASKNEVLQRLLGICDELSSFSDLCSSLIRNNFDELYETLNSEVPLYTGCHLSGMCASKYHFHQQMTQIDFLTPVDVMVTSKKDDLPCDLCKQMVIHFKDVLSSNTTEEEFHQVLQGICEQTGKFRNECNTLVNNYFQMIYKFLTEELDPEKFCEAIQICPKPPSLFTDGKVNQHLLVAVPVNEFQLTALTPLKVADAECSVCQSIVTEAERLMSDPNTSKEIDEVLHEVCNFIPSSEQEACNQFIHTYIDTLINLLSTKTDPRVVCSLMKVCTQVSTQVQKNRELCYLCQYVLHFVQTEMDDHREQEKVVKELLKTCTLLPQGVRSECKQFVNEYSNLIISMLAQEIDPSVVCPVLKVCPGVDEPERCGHCRTMMTNLIENLDGKYELSNIKSKIATFMPVTGDRTYAVAAELKIAHQEDIIDMMLADFDADESCVYLQFCDVKEIHRQRDDVVDWETNELTDTELDSVAGKPSCEICEMLVRVYEEELTSNKTEEEIQDVLIKFCHRLRRPHFQAKCSKLVDSYLTEFLNLLKKGVSPQELCAAVKLCSLQHLTSPNECTECEIAVGAVESVIGDPRTSQTIDIELSKLCPRMSGKARQICGMLVNEILPQVEGFVFNIPPWFVCSKLHACPYRGSFNETVCSNPESQCKSVKNAFQCDKLQFCRNTVWKLSKPPSQ